MLWENKLHGPAFFWPWNFLIYANLYKHIRFLYTSFFLKNYVILWICLISALSVKFLRAWNDKEQRHSFRSLTKTRCVFICRKPQTIFPRFHWKLFATGWYKRTDVILCVSLVCKLAPACSWFRIVFCRIKPTEMLIFFPVKQWFSYSMAKSKLTCERIRNRNRLWARFPHRGRNFFLYLCWKTTKQIFFSFVRQHMAF